MAWNSQKQAVRLLQKFEDGTRLMFRDSILTLTCHFEICSQPTSDYNTFRLSSRLQKTKYIS